MPNSPAPSRQALDEAVVFTGDLVASSKLTPEDLARAMSTLEAASGEVAQVLGGIAPRFSIFRGDSWQCLGPEPRFALRGALVIRASLSALGRAFDTRISIGVGSGWQAGAPDLGLASGPAFEISGRGLDTMAHARRFAIAWAGPRAGASLVGAIVAL